MLQSDVFGVFIITCPCHGRLRADLPPQPLPRPLQQMGGALGCLSTEVRGSLPVSSHCRRHPGVQRRSWHEHVTYPSAAE